jgi:hypothetical protein
MKKNLVGFWLSSVWMRSSWLVRAPVFQSQSRYSPGFDPGILRGNLGAADKEVNVYKKEKIIQKNPPFYKPLGVVSLS